MNGFRSPLEARESRQGRESHLRYVASPDIAPQSIFMAASVMPIRQIHRRDLSLPPKNQHELKTHTFRELFTEAQKQYLKSYREMGFWQKIHREEAESNQLLDSMWVMLVTDAFACRRTAINKPTNWMRIPTP
jgi:hypothetical protein